MNEVVNPESAHIPKVFVVCDRSDTAPVWSYILRQQGLIVILETSREKAIDRAERIDKSLFAGNWTKYALKHRLDFQPLFQFQPLESLAHVRERDLNKVRNCSI